jgi:YteA family regulatory protein
MKVGLPEMDTMKLNEFKERLLKEKERIGEELKNSNRLNLNESMTESIQELSAYDNHPADLGSETFEREKDLALWNNLHEHYLRVNEALGYIEQGKYGVCENCDREIGLERLEALPYTTLCINCQRGEEDHFVQRDRPVEEEVLWPPFNRTFLDGKTVVEFDGEDTWQKVARYGSSDTPSDVGGADSYDDTFYDSDEDQGMVEEVEGIIDVGPDEIPPDPGNRDQE